MNDYGYILIKTPEDMAKYGPKQKGDQIEFLKDDWQDLIDSVGRKFQTGFIYRRPIIAGKGFEIVPELEARKFDGVPKLDVWKFLHETGKWYPATKPLWNGVDTFRRRSERTRWFSAPYALIELCKNNDWSKWHCLIDGKNEPLVCYTGLEDIQADGRWTEIPAAEASEILARRNPATSIQPQPKGQGADITELVKQDLEARAVMGEKKYGTRLRAHNGRNALTDAYQEALDLACYLRQAIEEGK